MHHETIIKTSDKISGRVDPYYEYEYLYELGPNVIDVFCIYLEAHETYHYYSGMLI